MFPKYFLYIIPTLLLPAQSFYIENDDKTWQNDKPIDFPYDSIEETIIRVPAKNETQIKDILSNVIARTKEDVHKKMKTIDQVHRSFENNSFYKVKAVEIFVSRMLRVLHDLMTNKQKLNLQDKRNKQNSFDSGIAWSYYDDTGH